MNPNDINEAIGQILRNNEMKVGFRVGDIVTTLNKDKIFILKVEHFMNLGVDEFRNLTLASEDEKNAFLLEDYINGLSTEEKSTLYQIFIPQNRIKIICQNCKWFNGYSRCLKSNSIPFKTNEEVSPYDGCTEFELKENIDKPDNREKKNEKIAVIGMSQGVIEFISIFNSEDKEAIANKMLEYAKIFGISSNTVEELEREMLNIGRYEIFQIKVENNTK